MAKFRIYALIHGETLPERKIFDCEIKKMNFEEQSKREFSPIQSTFSEGEDVDYYRTYVTSLPYIDSVRIKSEHVIICDIEEDKPGDALGGAIRTIDRIVRFLTLACLQDIKKKFGANKGAFEPYIYQVNKIYVLDENGKETDIDFQLESGHMYLPNRPEFSEWRDANTENFLDEIYNFHNEILERALKYLYRSSIGYLILDSAEKIALDHFKSIEIIIDSLSNKDTFKKRLEEATAKINITSDEKKRIESFYDERSNGDVAHSSPFDQAERYPNQFPLPNNVQYSGAGFDPIAGSIILKYFGYVKGIFTIDICEIDDKSGGTSKEGSFSHILTLFPFNTNNQNHLGFHTAEKDKNRLKSKLKKAFAEHYKIPIKSIVEMTLEPSNKSRVAKRKFKLRTDTTGRSL